MLESALRGPWNNVLGLTGQHNDEVIGGALVRCLVLFYALLPDVLDEIVVSF